jgi:hypothetical protein
MITMSASRRRLRSLEDRFELTEATEESAGSIRGGRPPLHATAIRDRQRRESDEVKSDEVKSDEVKSDEVKRVCGMRESLSHR